MRVRERILEEELAQVAVNPAMRKLVEAERLCDTCRERLLETIKGYSRRALERAIDDFKDTLDKRDIGERESLLWRPTASSSSDYETVSTSIYSHAYEYSS